MKTKIIMALTAIAMLASSAFAGYGVYEWYGDGGWGAGHWHLRGYVVSPLGGWVGCDPGGGPGGNGIIIVDETNGTGVPGNPGQHGGSCYIGWMSVPCCLYFRPTGKPQAPDPINAMRLVETQPILTRQDYRLPILLSWFNHDPVAATQYAHSRAFEGSDGAAVAATIVSQMSDENAQTFIATLPLGNVRSLVESWRGMGGRDMSEAWMQMHTQPND